MTNTHTADQVERFRNTTIATAERLLAERFPQYRGHWNGWRAVRITRDVRTKLGPAFKAGEWTIATVAPAMPEYGLPARVVAFSLSNVCDTFVGPRAVEWLEGRPTPAKG